MKNQLEAANELNLDSEQENKLLLAENKELNENLGRQVRGQAAKCCCCCHACAQSDDLERSAAKVQQEKERADRAEAALSTTMEQVRQLGAIEAE